MDEKTTLVVTAVPNPSEMDSVQEYLRGVLPLLTGAGGKLVKRLKTDTVLRGGGGAAQPPRRLSPSAAATASATASAKTSWPASV